MWHYKPHSTDSMYSGNTHRNDGKNLQGDEEQEEFGFEDDIDLDDDVDIDIDTDEDDDFDVDLDADDEADVDIDDEDMEDEDFGDEDYEDFDFSELDDQEEDDPDRQGIIRTVPNAHLVYKRSEEDGTFTELWIYNVGEDFEEELQTRRAILAGTDIENNKMMSPDGQQKFSVWTAGNAQLLQVTGLPS